MYDIRVSANLFGYAFSCGLSLCWFSEPPEMYVEVGGSETSRETMYIRPKVCMESVESI